MGTENKRGRRLGSPGARLERRSLGGYPDWESWRVSFINRLEKGGIEYTEFDEKEKQVLHRWYVVRRRLQAGLSQNGEVQDFWDQNEMDEHFDEETEEYKNENFGEAITLLTSLTRG